MFNLNDIIGSVTEFMSSGVQESEIVQQITDNMTEIQGPENILPKK